MINMMTMTATVDQIIQKHQNGLTLTPWETSVYCVNVRPDGSRYSDNTKEREAQMDADIKAEQIAKRRKA